MCYTVIQRWVQIGCLAYEMLAGRSPFEFEIPEHTATAVLFAHVSAWPPTISPRMQSFISSCLRKVTSPPVPLTRVQFLQRCADWRHTVISTDRLRPLLFQLKQLFRVLGLTCEACTAAGVCSGMVRYMVFAAGAPVATHSRQAPRAPGAQLGLRDRCPRRNDPGRLGEEGAACVRRATPFTGTGA